MAAEKRILLHICCAPCACFPNKALSEDGYSITGYWYNPNIHGFREYSKRLMTLGYFIARTGKMDIIESRYSLERWVSEAAAADPQERCRACYRVRMEETAAKAAETGIDCFTTTLLYSKYQDHECVRETAEKAAAAAGVSFLYRDFRAGWKAGIELSREMGLYRQGYCGCLFSEKERFYAAKKSKDIRF